ncbi:phosphate ABC transporter permease subunit PstC [Moraxella catarrhalis]|jgi:phosphate ABC transporter, permease protein pstC|uniref:Phosphate transport system permease protein n=2 Tax=Bacteria TaxID=2 RepID=A0A3A9RFD0_MORCA|nr:MULTISPECIES: phosphate ABC transporter permease subunit PstC [Moraxella]ADG61990.1 phosphate ABC transporter permease protein PstC [Moraxella catarrhalis BBH18]AIJ99998.1 phosphate ABC transporter, permease protein PstC [Moraxella catarrhalis]AIT44024.1 Phosphate transport system permease protein pstC [Moraxella catarrhalis]ARB66815.1 phosphate ABC transporter permease subunit PstC [Moraxella catarrhalis]ARE66827.1 phosphate ABC transporter permease subunit PstC [Moraxella catarrhalis]
MTTQNSALAARLSRQKRLDGAFVWTTKLSALLVLLTLGGIMLSLVFGAIPSIREFGLNFYTSSNWDPVAGQFGALAPIYGTIVTSIIAVVIAVPVSFGIAVFLTELCPNFLKKPLGIAIELLAGIPSIIYGMWGLFVFAPWFGDTVQPWLINHLAGLPIIGQMFVGAPIGIGLFTAGLVLAIMIIPFIAATMRDVFLVVPDLLKESAYGMGATTWEVVTKVVLPYTKAGVVGGLILGLGRALGETMAVTFLIGNTFNINTSLFTSGVSITSALANEFAEASSEMHLSSLLHLGLILFVISFIVLSASKLMLMKIDKRVEK